MNNKTLPAIVAVMLIAIVGVIEYKLSPERNTAPDIRRLPTSTCNPSQDACTVDLPGGGKLDFSIEPRPIKALQPLRLKTATQGLDVQGIEVDFNGTDMDMGRNRVVLTKDGQGFSGQAMLPVCVTGTMSWTAMVLLTSRNTRLAVPFQFAIAGR